ncbi:rhodanese-like domain-containing protein [Roseomonas fluvialis]|nr:hypothetical protein [Roseomonas fluvialis]
MKLVIVGGVAGGASCAALLRLGMTDYEKVLCGQTLSRDAAWTDKRISALAMAIQMGATIDDLAESELCYAPQFGSAKDPLNFAGMMARSILDGDMPVAHGAARGDGLLLDVCEAPELAVESVPGALHIPLGQSRDRISECRGTARSRSSAAPGSAPTTRRVCCCRTASARGRCRAACSRAPCWSLARQGSLMPSIDPRR